MPHFVYILYSSKRDRYYIGETRDVDTRLTYHNHLNQGGYTSRFRPWALVLQIEVDDYLIARKVERHIKRQKNLRYILALIHDPEFRLINLLSTCPVSMQQFAPSWPDFRMKVCPLWRIVPELHL